MAEASAPSITSGIDTEMFHGISGAITMPEFSMSSASSSPPCPRARYVSSSSWSATTGPADWLQKIMPARAHTAAQAGNRPALRASAAAWRRTPPSTPALSSSPAYMPALMAISVAVSMDATPPPASTCCKAPPAGR